MELLNIEHRLNRFKTVVVLSISRIIVLNALLTSITGYIEQTLVKVQFEKFCFLYRYSTYNKK